jgi:hypothetical protein
VKIEERNLKKNGKDDGIILKSIKNEEKIGKQK